MDLCVHKPTTVWDTIRFYIKSTDPFFFTENKFHIYTTEKYAPILACHIPQFKDAKIPIKAHKNQEVIVSEQLFDG